MKQKVIILCCMLIAGLYASASDIYAITAPNIIGGTGDVVMLPVKLYNTQPIRDLDLHLVLPEGVTLKKDDNGENIVDINTNLAPYHTANAELSNGVCKIVITTTRLSSILSDNQVLFTLPLVLDTEIGEYQYAFDYVCASQDIDNAVTNIFMAGFSGEITVEPPTNVLDNQVYSTYLVADVNVHQATLDICMKNNQAVKSFNFDIEFPEGITPIFNEDEGDYVAYGDRIPGRFNVSSEIIDGMLNVDGYAKSVTVGVGDGPILTLGIDAKVATGKYPIVFKNQSLTLSDGSDVTPPDYTSYIVVDKTPEMTNVITYHDELIGDNMPRNYVAKDVDGNWTANEVYLQDANPITVDYTFMADKVTYKRNFTYSVWQAMYVPYNLAYEDWATMGKVAELAGVTLDENNNPVLKWQLITEGELKANHPYIFKPLSDGDFEFTSTNRTFVPTDQTETVSYSDKNNNVYTLAGVTQYKYDMYTTDAYGMAPNGNFMRVTSNAVMLKPMRIYLIIEQPVYHTLNCVNILVDENTTNIEGLEINIQHDGKYYNISGQEIDNPNSGIYIHNGKKIMVK